MWEIFSEFSFEWGIAAFLLYTARNRRVPLSKLSLNFPRFSRTLTRLFRLFSSSDSRWALKTIWLWKEMVELIGEFHRKITTGALQMYLFFSWVLTFRMFYHLTLEIPCMYRKKIFWYCFYFSHTIIVFKIRHRSF